MRSGHPGKRRVCPVGPGRGRRHDPGHVRRPRPVYHLGQDLRGNGPGQRRYDRLPHPRGRGYERRVRLPAQLRLPARQPSTLQRHSGGEDHAGPLHPHLSRRDGHSQGDGHHGLPQSGVQYGQRGRLLSGAPALCPRHSPGPGDGRLHPRHAGEPEGAAAHAAP